ncbi:MAG: calcium-binding protein [Myxococcales bacterium]|nr:calcium-binding protein [Myxococcales bacterium]
MNFTFQSSPALLRALALTPVLAALVVFAPACGPERDIEGESCDEREIVRSCGALQVQYCYWVEGEEYEWGECVLDDDGEDTDTDTDGDDGDGGDNGDDQDGGYDDWTTPLVLSFDHAPIRYTAAGAASFDIAGTGGCLSTDWPEPSTPWLALDRDGDGEISSGRELFGSGTILASGAAASNGFIALAELDDDGDGRITPNDAGFAQLVLWSDDDGDRQSSAWELMPLSSRGVTAIELGYNAERRCDARGNCGIERSGFTFFAAGTERRGELVDVHLPCR